MLSWLTDEDFRKRRDYRERALLIATVLVVFLMALLVGLSRGQQILSPAQLQQIRDHLPLVEPGVIRDTMLNERTIWYDRESMGVVYQIGAGGAAAQEFDGTRMLGISNALFNISGDFPENQRPNGFGGNANALDPGSFPWKPAPGGTHHAESLAYVDTAKAFLLPLDDAGKPWPVIVYHRELEGEFQPTPTVTGWDWLFPVGTVFLELQTVNDNERRQHYVSEIRARIRGKDSWGVELVRPFPTADSLAGELEERGHAATAQALTASTRLVSRTLRDSTPGNQRFGTRANSAFSVSARVDVLPPLPRELVAELLDTTVFRSATSIDWKPGCPAPTTDADFHIVPKEYHGAFVGNDSIGCANCHRSTQISARRHNAFNGKYGWVRGNREGILSWHPFENPPNSSVVVARPRLRTAWTQSGLVAFYDHGKHPASVYRPLDGPNGKDER